MIRTAILGAAIGGEIVSLVEQTGLVAKTVLLILLIFSIVSWGIILSKWSALRRARAQSGRFLRAFRRAQRLQDFATVSDQFKPSPLVQVFEGAYDEFRRQGDGNLTAVQRAAQIASSEQLTRLETRLPLLATTGAVTPFIGLFGTVWGIIDAFSQLGITGTTDLKVVGPGIARALIATALGLGAAIPAAVSYNYFGSAIKEIGARLEDFCLEFLNLTERTFEE